MRAMRYIGQYRRAALLAYGALFVAAAAQLAVPQMLQNIIDTIIKGYVASRVLALPAAIQSLAAQQTGLSLAQLQADQANAPQAIIWALVAIVIFAVARGLFSFVQSYMAQSLSQDIAFSLRD